MKTRSFFYAPLFFLCIFTAVQCHKNTEDSATGINADALSQLNLTAQALKDHQFMPPHVSDIQSDDNADIKEEDLAALRKEISSRLPVLATPRAVPAFDPNIFGPLIHNIFKDQVMGYSFQVYKNNAAIYSGQWKMARSLADGNKVWNADTRMHIASTSKLMTAIGLVKLLDKKNISLDAFISPYLPSYWQRGIGFAERVTFRKLLNHTSGFSEGNSRCDYLYMKEQVAKIPNEVVDKSIYANVNFSIMRVLITVLDGKLTADAYRNDPVFSSDILWDFTSTTYFKDYMNKEVFALAGLPTIGFSPEVGGPTAKAYASNSDVFGRDGDWSTVAGGAGFYMSVAQVLKTLDAFRNNKIILPTLKNPNRAQYMLDNSLGINGALATPAGQIYYRKGSWSVGGREEQTAIYSFPNNVNMAFFVNSPTPFLTVNGYTNVHIHYMISLAIKASIH